MSIQESLVGHSQGKAGLKRKLTGPPRLLLSKSKAKSHQDDTLAGSHIGGNDSNGTNRDTVLTQQYPIREEGSTGSNSENSLKPVKSEEQQATPEILTESEKCTAANESETKTEHLDDKSNQKKKSIKRVWKRFFFPALTCVRRRKQMGKKLFSEGQTADDTFCTTEPGESVDCGLEPAPGDAVTSNEEQGVETPSVDKDPAVKGKVKFSAGAWWSIKRLLTVSNGPQKAKGRSQQEHFQCEDILPPDFSLKKKVRYFLKRGAKKPSPFFHERLGTNHEYIEEETIVLSNRHADDADQTTPPNDQEGEQSDGDIEDKGPCSETLTVSAEVTVMEEKGDRAFTETSTDLEASVNLIDANHQRENEENHEEYADVALEASDVVVTIDRSEADQYQLEYLVSVRKDSLVELTPKENEASQGASSPSRSNDVAMKAEELPSEGHDLRSPIDTHFSSCVEVAVAKAENVLEENMLPSICTDEDSTQDTLAVKNVKFNALDLCYGEGSRAVENGPEVNLHTGDTDSYGYEPELSSQCNDILLVQTACSLVQAALRAALDQLTVELKDKSAGINVDAQECQDHT